MQEISQKESFELFVSTLSRLDEKSILLPDNELLDMIFEDLDIEVISYLHSETIDSLVKNNLIPDSISSSIFELRKNLIELIEHKRSIEEIRNDIDWKRARQLAQKILKIVNAKKS